MRIIIDYDPISGALSVPENDFTHIEAMGVLTATIQTIGKIWLDSTDCEVYEDDRDDETDN